MEALDKHSTLPRRATLFLLLNAIYMVYLLQEVSFIHLKTTSSPAMFSHWAGFGVREVNET